MIGFYYYCIIVTIKYVIPCVVVSLTFMCLFRFIFEFLVFLLTINFRDGLTVSPATSHDICGFLLLFVRTLAQNDASFPGVVTIGDGVFVNSNIGQVDSFTAINLI